MNIHLRKFRYVILDIFNSRCKDKRKVCKIKADLLNNLLNTVELYLVKNIHRIG